MSFEDFLRLSEWHSKKPFQIYSELAYVDNSLKIQNINLLITYDFVPLINMILAWEKHPTANHFSHDASNGPYVNIIFVTHAKNHLWSSEGFQKFMVNYNFMEILLRLMINWAQYFSVKRMLVF